MSYARLITKLDCEAHKIMMDLQGFCETISKRIEEKSIEVQESEEGFEFRIQEEIGIDFEKKILSLRNGEPEVVINTATGRMTARWNTSKETCKFPANVAEAIHNRVSEVYARCAPDRELAPSESGEGL